MDLITYDVNFILFDRPGNIQIEAYDEEELDMILEDKFGIKEYTFGVWKE